MASQRICSVCDCDKAVLARGLCSWHYKQAPFRPSCSIEGCEKKVYSAHLCVMHYKRLKRNGDVNAVQRNANGTYQTWLEDNASHSGEECLIWPFWRDKNGYGPIRDKCALAHGEPPTQEHQAAHSCGNGHEGCIHPRHLRWATRLENQSEMVDHGKSQRGTVNWNNKLTESQVIEIRSLRGKFTSMEIAEKFGVSRGSVTNIFSGKKWGWLQ